MARRLPADLRRIAARLQANPGCGRGKRSQLYRWMLVRADDLERMIADLQPSWSSLAQALADAGLHDGSGKPPSAERCRKTWHAVKTERLRRLQHSAPGRATSQARDSPVVAVVARSATPVIRPVAIAPPPDIPDREVLSGSDDLQRVLSEMGARDKKLPDPLT